MMAPGPRLASLSPRLMPELRPRIRAMPRGAALYIYTRREARSRHRSKGFICADLIIQPSPLNNRNRPGTFLSRNFSPPLLFVKPDKSDRFFLGLGQELLFPSLFCQHFSSKMYAMFNFKLKIGGVDLEISLKTIFSNCLVNFAKLRDKKRGPGVASFNHTCLT